MYYTDYLKKEIFTDRQTAINSSRLQAKDEFFHSLVESKTCYDDDGDPMSYLHKKITDYKEIKELFNAYEKNRCIIYEVKIEDLDYPF